MSEQVTGRHFLPLLQPAQAQKHVTVNESLLRLDGLVNLVLQGAARVQPPAVVEGECWWVPPGAVDAWAWQAGRIAIGANGGWVFATPQRGQRAFLLDRGAEAVWDGQEWRGGALTLGLWGGGISAGILEAEVSLGAGAVVATGVMIPSHVLVFGVTARVVEPISGTLGARALGVSPSVAAAAKPRARACGPARFIRPRPARLAACAAIRAAKVAAGGQPAIVASAAHRRPRAVISATAPWLPMRESFMISSRCSGLRPPLSPSARSASPSSCSAPVSATPAAMAKAAASCAGRPSASASHNAPPIPRPTTAPASGAAHWTSAKARCRPASSGTGRRV